MVQHTPFGDENTEAQRGAGTCQDHIAGLARSSAISKPKASSPSSYVLQPESGAGWLCLHWATLQDIWTPLWEGGYMHRPPATDLRLRKTSWHRGTQGKRPLLARISLPSFFLVGALTDYCHGVALHAPFDRS